MGTRANIVIEYMDYGIGGPSELWLYHPHDGNVQGIGEAVVRAVHACGWYVDDGASLERLWNNFPNEFENATGLQDDVEFLYRITYADDMVRVVVRHGGYVGEEAAQHYNRANDTSDNSVNLLNITFDEHGDSDRQWHDIREPESYIRTLPEAERSAVRAWRGTIAVRSSNMGAGGQEPDRRPAEQAQHTYDEFFDESMLRTVEAAEDRVHKGKYRSDGHVLEQQQAREALSESHVGIATETEFFLTLITGGGQRARLKVALDKHSDVADASMQVRDSSGLWIEVPKQDKSLLKRFANEVGFHLWLP